MKNIKVIFAALLYTGVLYSCSYTAPEPAEDPTNPRTPPVAGSADFSKYVAVGNSLTAGFMDNALYLEGQQNAYPAILGNRMQYVNDNAAFNIPAFGAEGGAGFGGVIGNNTPVGRYQFVLPNCGANGALTKTLNVSPAPTIPGEPISPYSGNRAEINNFGVPGAKIFHALVPGYGTLNPFFGRFASSATASMIADAVAAKGTFFTYWLGNNDVLAYATSGGSGNPNPGLDPTAYGSNDMTNPLVFTLALSNSLDALLATGATTKGAVATIPEVIKIPFFQLINAGLIAGGANAPLPFALSAGQAAALNAGYAQLGPAAAGVNFKAGKVNYPVITTATGLRHMDPTKDFLILTTPQDSLLVGPISACNLAQRGGWGVYEPIPAQYVLDQTEAQLAAERVITFNNIIKQQVSARNERLVLVDTNLLLANLNPANNNLAPPDGYFSLDGVHPNPRGQALIANEFIKAINAKFGSTLPPVNITTFRLNTYKTQ